MKCKVTKLQPYLGYIVVTLINSNKTPCDEKMPRMSLIMLYDCQSNTFMNIFSAKEDWTFLQCIRLGLEHQLYSMNKNSVSQHIFRKLVFIDPIEL